jgi:hypothetical protein
MRNQGDLRRLITCSESQLWFARGGLACCNKRAQCLRRVEFAVAFRIRSCSLFPESMDLLEDASVNLCLPGVHFDRVPENYSRQSCHCSERPLRSYICFRHESGLKRALGVGVFGFTH